MLSWPDLLRKQGDHAKFPLSIVGASLIDLK